MNASGGRDLTWHDDVEFLQHVCWSFGGDSTVDTYLPLIIQSGDNQPS
jgi:hypothetical protein